MNNKLTKSGLQELAKQTRQGKNNKVNYVIDWLSKQFNPIDDYGKLLNPSFQSDYFKHNYSIILTVLTQSAHFEEIEFVREEEDALTSH